MLFTSGQIPIDPATGDIHGADITEQAEQVMKNLAAVLEEAGTTFENAVKTLPKNVLVEVEVIAAL